MQIQTFTQSYLHIKLQRIISLFLLATFVSSCNSVEENNLSINVICDSISAQSEITSDVRSFDRISFQNESTVNILLEQVESQWGITYNTYHWDLSDQSIIKVVEQNLKFPLPCDCKAKIIDNSPDGNWQIIDATLFSEDGSPSYKRWLISENGQYDIGWNAQNWFWSTDGHYFSYIANTNGPIGLQLLLDLESLSIVWESLEDIEEHFDTQDGFLQPWALSHNITFSPVEKTYWYRAWFEEDQNKIYIYDPINHKGRIEQIENIRSAIWNDRLNQLLFVKSDDEYITIASVDGLISAKIPYDLYLKIDGNGLESELTHTNFQVSPEGRYVVFPRRGQLYALGCHSE